MKFLALVSRKSGQFTEEQIAAWLEPEAEHVRKLYTQGIFRAVHGRGDVKGAVIELEAADLAEAKQIVETLPFAQQGMVDTEIIPLLPYRGFAPRNS